MTTQITPDQALALSFSPFRYRTPMFKQGHVVRDDDGETVYELAETQRFIKPGKTSTAEYVASFEASNHLRATGSAAHLKHPAPLYETPDVVVNEYADDLV